MFERILVAVDGSKGADGALEKAARLAAQSNAELLILTVYRHHSMTEASLSMVRPEDPESLDDVMRDHARAIAERAKQDVAAHGIERVRAFVKSGQPARTIVKFGREHDAALIVIGSRGLGDIEGFLLGSVSHKVTSLANCPVMVV